jgi:hypothetical protein
MNPWSAYPVNLPNRWDIYIVWRGSRDTVTTAYYNGGWVECRNDRKMLNVTHYAEIQSPEEDQE